MEHFISRWLVLTIAAGVMVTLLPGMHAVGEPPILGILLYLVVFRFGLTECLEIEKRWYFNAFAIL